MIFDDDLDVFFGDEFAESAFVSTNEIKVIFDLAQEIQSDYQVIGYKPVAKSDKIAEQQKYSWILKG